MRLNKFLAKAEVASRRKSDQIIKSGKVKVNDKIIREPWYNVDPDNDKVKYNDNDINLSREKIYIMLNKPEGYITTVSDEKNRKTVIDLVGIDKKIFPMGRLDKDSKGLLLLTNDGHLAFKLTHPKFETVKRYRVKLNKPLVNSVLQKMENGIWISKKEKVKGKGKILNLSGERNLVEIQIFQGRKRQIKRMFGVFGYHVVELERIQFGGLRLGDLKEGEWRYLSEREVNIIENSIKDENSNG